MKYLKEIAKIITRKKIMKIEIFDEATLKDNTSKFNKFYNALLDGKYNSDDEAAGDLYGSNSLDDRYRQLKSRFKKRFLNTLFFIDINLPATSTYDRAYFSVNKDWTLVKILIANNALNTAGSLARSIFTTSLKFRFADAIVNSGRILREKAAREDDEKLYEYYDQHCKQYANVLDAEIRSEELYQRVVMNYYKPSSKKTNLEERIDTYCDALTGLSETYNSPLIYFHASLVWIYRYEMLRDVDNKISRCKECLKYIEQNPEYYKNDVAITIYKKLQKAYLHKKDFDNAKRIGDYCLKRFNKGSETWFELIELYFLVATNTDHLLEARKIYLVASSHPRFKDLDEEKRLKWETFDIYLNLYFYTHPVYRVRYNSYRTKTFRLNKFKASIIDADNRTFRPLYVQQLIFKSIFYYMDNQLTKVDEELDELKAISNRQLKKEEHIRINQFIKLLQQWKKSNFGARPVSNTFKYLQKIEETPLIYRGLLDELELVPYDSFWNYILQLEKYNA